MFYKRILFLSLCTSVLGSSINKKIEAGIFTDFKDIALQLEESLKMYSSSKYQQSIKKDLAKIYFHLGNYNQARIYLEEIIDQDHDDLIFNAYLGAVYDELSEHVKAQEILEFCIKTYREKMPNNTFDIAFALMHLGKTLSQQGKYRKSEESLLESINKYQELSNAEYLIKAQTLLAETYMYKGDYKKAEPYFENVIAEYSKTSYPVIWTQLRLGRLYMFTGEYKKAEPIFKTGVDILKADQNIDYDRLGWNLFYLGDIYRSLLKFDESEKSMKEGLEAFKTCGYDTQHQIIQWGNAYLGRLYCDWGQHEKAEFLLEESLKIHEEKYGQNSKRNAFIMQALANTYMHLQEYSKAKTLLEKSLEIYEKQFGTAHTEYAQVLLDFGVLDYEQKDYETATNRLKTALQILGKERHSSATKCQAFLEKIMEFEVVSKTERQAYYKSYDESNVMQLHDQLLDAFKEELAKNSQIQEEHLLTVSILDKKEKKKDYKIPENFFFSGDIKWHGINAEHNPKDFESLLKILEDKNKMYVEGRSENGQSSHAVCIKNGFVFKFLNLTKEDGTSDEEPEMEMICSSFYHFMGIGPLIAQMALIKIEPFGLIQISREIKDGYTKESDLDENISGQQYIMSLLLSFGDAKVDNFRIQDKKLIAIDTEMAFRKPVRNHDERGAVFGNYCFLFRTDFNQRKIPETIKVWIEEIWGNVNVENEMKSFFYQIFGNEEQQKQFEDKKTTQTVLMISEYRKRYDCLDKFFEKEKDREKLFICFAKFYLNLNSTYEKITEKKDTDMTYLDLLVEYDSNLASGAIRSEGSSDHSAITKEEDIGLVNVSDFDYKYRIYRNYLHLINKKIENTSQWYSFLKDFPDVIVANRLQGLLEETNKEEGLSFYEKILEKYRNDAEFLYKYGCLLSKNNEKTRKISNASRSLLKQSADLGLDLAQFEYAELLWKEFENLDKYQKNDGLSMVNEALKYYLLSIKSGLHFMQARYAEICLTRIREYPTPYDQSISEEDVFKYLSKAFDQEPYIYLHNIADLYGTIKDEDVKIKIENKLFEIAAKFLGKEIAERESVQTIVQLIKDNTSSSPKKNNVVSEQWLYKKNIYETDAKKGNPIAANDCGMALYNLGDYSGAKYFFKISAELGNRRGKEGLALCDSELQKNLSPFDSHVYLEMVQERANKGDAESQCLFGDYYYYGYRLTQNYVEAVKWYEKAAKQGDAKSQNKLGHCYSNGYGVTQDYVEAVEWFEKAAKQGDATSQHTLGIHYYNGQGVEQNHVKAVEWFNKAAEQGCIESQCKLGWWNLVGFHVPQNYKKAFEYFQKTADQDCNHEALTNIAILYFYGWGMEQNYQMALDIFALAADDGNEEAMYFLGLIFLNGYSIDKNIKEAVDYFKKSSSKKFFPSLYTMGVFFEEGKYIDKDPEKANELYKQAFEEFPNQYASFSEFYSHIMGEMYEYGRGVEKNITEALKWYERGAKQNHPAAQYALARHNGS